MKMLCRFRRNSVGNSTKTFYNVTDCSQSDLPFYPY